MMGVPYYEIVDGDGGPVLKVYLDRMSTEAKARCGTDFNPSGDPRITLAKALCVGAMNMAVYESGNAPAWPLSAAAAAQAAARFEEGQMLLVKALVHASKER